MRHPALARSFVLAIIAFTAVASGACRGIGELDRGGGRGHGHTHALGFDRDFEALHREPRLPHVPSRGLAPVPHHPRAAVPPPSLAHALAPGSRRIEQRILLLAATGEEPAYHAAKHALARIGIPFATLIATQEPLVATALTDGASRCHFAGVIIATSGLAYFDAATGSWRSALELDEWQVLADFESACGAREVVWYAWPSPDLGLAPGPEFDSTAAVDARLTAAGQTFFRRVNADAVIPYRGAWGYRAAIADPATTTALVVADGGGVLVALRTAPDGRETLVSTADSNPYATHGLVLEYDMLRWLTRGLFVGKKRAYLSAQIDDVFLDNDMWVVGEGNEGTTQLRITGADLDAFVRWQTARQATLPPGSTFITDMAFNGAGTQVSHYADTSLLRVARRAGRKLAWLNHTWDHENMDAMGTADARAEVAQNCELARTLLLPGFRCTELVSPEVSGLTNPAALRGMLAAGVRYTVSDTSVTEEVRPGYPGDNPSFNVGRFNPIDARMYHVPRHPTSIYYDVATPEAEADEYNSIYRDYFGRDLTYDEVIDNDSAFGLFYLLQGDIDPLMFHQANLARYVDGDGRTRSLYADWVDAVLGKFLALTSVPVLTVRLADTGVAMKQRGELDACGATATIVEAGAGASLELRTAGACTVPITGLAAPSAGGVEVYAGEPTTSIPMPAGGVRTIALP